MTLKRDKVIFHVDVNSAYLSWEAVHRLVNGETVDIRKIPSVIGGNEKSRRGIVLAKSYPCKQYGIKTGETISEARKKCPFLVVVPNRSEIYQKASNAMFDILLEYSDNVQKYSIDEGFIDFSDNPKVLENPFEAGEEIRKRIENELGFTVCVGIGDNKVLAKMAGELRKPNYTNTLFSDELYKIWNLPIGELFMVGNKTEKTLRSFGIDTIGKLAKTDINFLKMILKEHGQVIWNYANGHEISVVKKEKREPKSCGHSMTLSKNIEDKKSAEIVFMALTEKVCTRLRNDSLAGDTVTISCKFADFSKYTQQITLKSATNNVNEMFANVIELFDETWNKEPIRAIGVRVSGLSNENKKQISLFEVESKNTAQLNKAIDDIRKKYGNDKVVRCSQIKNGYVKSSASYEFMQSLNINF